MTHAQRSAFLNAWIENNRQTIADSPHRHEDYNLGFDAALDVLRDAVERAALEVAA